VIDCCLSWAVSDLFAWCEPLYTPVVACWYFPSKQKVNVITTCFAKDNRYKWERCTIIAIFRLIYKLSMGDMILYIVSYLPISVPIALSIYWFDYVTLIHCKRSIFRTELITSYQIYYRVCYACKSSFMLWNLLMRQLTFKLIQKL
jgi:hypothetical protein